MALIQKRSLIWEYFDIFKEDRKLAVCYLCNKKISRGGEGKKAGTTAMKNHLKNKHPEQFATISAGLSKIKITKPVTLAASAYDASSSSSVPVHAIQEKKEKTTERKRLWDINDLKSKNYHNLIAEMIILDKEPFSTVERIGFTRLMEKVVPQYKMPSSNYMIEKVIPEMYERIHAKIESSISQSSTVSITSDIWTCLQNNVTVLSFTAHWLSPELALKHAVLSIKFIYGLDTGVIARELNEIAEKWDIPTEKIHLHVHNSTVDMMPAAEYDSARCFIHTLQRAVDESLKSQPDLMETLTVARQIVSYFDNSDVAQRKLKAIRQEINLSDQNLVQDVRTRWISTYYLMVRLLEQKRAVSLYVTDHNDLANLTQSQWELMEECIKLLKPLEEITKITSSGLSCISEVIPHINTLIKYLGKEETAIRTPNLSNMRFSLKFELEKRFENENYDKYLVATFLDPRFKTHFLEIVEVERAKHYIVLGALRMGCQEENTEENDASPPTKKSCTGDIKIKIEKDDSFWLCFEEVATSYSNEGREKVSIESEIEFYMKTLRIDRMADPYKWWSANTRQYPILSEFVKVYLSSPSSSIYNEKLFSEPGLSFEENRQRSVTTNEEMIVFIQHNLPLIDFNY